MKTLQDLKVGDQVWWSDVNRKGLSSGTVSEIGTKLITVGRGYGAIVFRKDSLHTNDDYGHQSLILDVDAYRERNKVTRIRHEIARAYGGSSSTPLRDAIKAAQLLGVPLPGDLEDD